MHKPDTPGWKQVLHDSRLVFGTFNREDLPGTCRYVLQRKVWPTLLPGLLNPCLLPCSANHLLLQSEASHILK